MADRTSAAIFGELFEFIAKDEPIDKQALAMRLWVMSRGYDFSDEQMGCNEALQKFGLARLRVNPEYPDEGEVWHYGPKGDDHP